MPLSSILIVDDDEANLVVLEEFLMDDYDVVACASADEALSVLRGRPFDLIISDQRMPYMTGVQLLVRARSIYPDMVRMILTAYSDAEAMLQAINEGHVYRFLLKPWDRVEMQAAIRQALEHREQELHIKRLVDELSAKNRELERSLGNLREARDKLLHTTKLATVGQLTSGLIHELKQHMSSLVVLQEVLEELDLPQETDEYVRHGIDSMTSIFHMVADMHSFAREDRWGLKRTWADVNTAVEDSVRFARLDRDFKDCELQAELGELPRCFLDRDKLQQILINLLRNAAHACGEGGGLLTVRTACSSDRVLISVSDNGPGVPARLRTRIWEPFFTSKGGKGLGLGLEISRKLVEAHEGQLRLEPESSSGATFTIQLPVEPPAMTD